MMKNKINLFLLSLGLSVNATTFILTQYINLSDFLKGGLFGIGIGLMLMSFLKKRQTA
ncbi:MULTISPECIES: hypothetical protein [Aequorivita]|uniref:Uncharacterized protein n=1 Tax=Aequorivita iocasae TaxID=2803865 RepID=A0ABX7DSK2_9FLAO|nr:MULTISPECIES: hypothetical protein [Aequorivita]QQX77130.1 hypothetical protein JK629_02330 [Aequorivita iocasae]UCA56617.1 hypothetical protein LDL78_02350 [Aequorivita sp. F7]